MTTQNVTKAQLMTLIKYAQIGMLADHAPRKTMINVSSTANNLLEMVK